MIVFCCRTWRWQVQQDDRFVIGARDGNNLRVAWGECVVDGSDLRVAWGECVVDGNDLRVECVVEYGLILSEIKSGAITLETRRRLCRHAFAHTARYDSLISTYLTERWQEKSDFPTLLNQPFEKVQELRYGENPHQYAALYKECYPLPSDIVSAQQLQGK